MNFFNLAKFWRAPSLISSLSLGVFIPKRCILFMLKDGNLKVPFHKIFFDVKEPLQGLNPLKVMIRIQGTFKFKRVESRVPQIILFSCRGSSPSSRWKFFLGWRGIDSSLSHFFKSHGAFFYLLPNIPEAELDILLNWWLFESPH